MPLGCRLGQTTICDTWLAWGYETRSVPNADAGRPQCWSADGFGLARASNTNPVVVLRFEADDAAALARIQHDFRRALLAARPDLSLPF